MDEKHQLKIWIENISQYIKSFWDLDTKRMSHAIKKDYNEFNQGRFAIIGGFLLLILHVKIWSIITSAALILWGYKRCKMVYPILKNELKFYKKDKN